ncbi:Heavy metal transport/detoxification protein [Desulforamulus reducens MI-1]|uniref:Heavy metal transport/detoxification protein n=1 Tax=Desulforamulus reducens (strain ATCC BAA-1160 / DSM 100696 / MI-1) TaxID=349161 RepID=A4J6F3_DESRM|nr:cation transporter [Desulforamulus reducens]ABO50656.1 Heavy metal transport/detoxification protein [Desulforamulus reducens MI-1]
MSEIVLKVDGMSCNHCKMAVEKAAKAINGVENATVNLEQKEVVVTGSVPKEEIVKAIEEAGYDVIG